MAGYVLSPAARRDIEQIWNYTAQQWGRAQAERYLLAIRDACQGLAENRLPSRMIDDIRQGYRQAPVGVHLVFFRYSPPGLPAGLVDVVRILHRRMDIARHL